jgi:hypothetical protein
MSLVGPGSALAREELADGAVSEADVPLCGGRRSSGGSCPSQEKARHGEEAGFLVLSTPRELPALRWRRGVVAEPIAEPLGQELGLFSC